MPNPALVESTVVYLAANADREPGGST